MKIGYTFPPKWYKSYPELRNFGDFIFIVPGFIRNDEDLAIYKEAASSREVYLDNGVYELKKPIKISELRHLISELSPKVVILPDYWRDGKKTIQSVMDSLLALSDCPCSFMAVPQGKDFNEYIECLEELLKISEIEYIGISKYGLPEALSASGYLSHLDPHAFVGVFRLFAWKEIESRIPVTKKIHLLGYGGTLDFILPRVYSLDTTFLAVVAQGKSEANDVPFYLKTSRVDPAESSRYPNIFSQLARQFLFYSRLWDKKEEL